MNYKVVLLGSVYVGKSSITRKFIFDRFNNHTESTIGCCFFKKQMFINNQQIILNIYDTAGSERFNTLLPMYTKNANVIMYVYDVTKVESFNRVKCLVKECQEEACLVLVANKLDLVNRVILYEEGKAYAEYNHMLFFECSAFTGEGIIEMFNAIAAHLIETNKSPIINNHSIIISDIKDKSCCY